MNDTNGMEENPRIVPKLKQRKDGTWTCKDPTNSKKPINLQTKKYSEARERAKEAVYDGKREWNNERFYDTSSTAPKTSGPVTGAPSGDWASDVADAVAGGLKPDLYVGSNGEVPLLNPMPDAGDSPEPPTDAPKVDNGPTGDGENTQIPPEMFERMLSQMGDMIVEAQIKGQEWLIARALKANAGPVPLSNIGRVEAAKFWNQQLAIWMPKDIPLPPWAVAVITTAMFTIPVQLAGATPIRAPETSGPNPGYKTE